jgi:hypothetical protein
MTPSTIARYQIGGDIYASLQTQYGTPAADAIAAAARTGDETNVNAAMVAAKYGSPLNDSTWNIFADQIITDPLAAPLESANSQIGKAVLNFLKNPWVLAAVAVGLFFFFGGANLIRKQLAK